MTRVRENSGGIPEFEARFSNGNDLYHVTKWSRYARLRRRGLDVHIPEPLTSQYALVLYKTSDRTIASEVVDNCGMDHQQFAGAVPARLPEFALQVAPHLSLLPRGLQRRAPAGCPTSAFCSNFLTPK